jgi:hypothetical protein
MSTVKEPIMGTTWSSILRLLALAAVLLPSLALADPPARVGRLAAVEGSVLFRIDRGDAGQPASINWPLSSGAILDTDPGARVEAWIGSSAFRLAGAGRLEFATIDDRLVFLQLAVGSLVVTVRDREQADNIEIRTPEGRVQFGRAGRYRIDAVAGRTTVTSRAGVAYLYAGGGRNYAVPEGRSAVLDSGGTAALYGELPPDGFDAWAANRDAASDAATARRYVSPEMTGYQDLDQYGDWETGGEYGVVWYPRHMPSGWAPYRHGRWAWVAPWGWTWIDEAPWGFAPFHYGRWAIIGGRWAWIPGAYEARPVYAPALVVWLGGSDWSIGAGPAVGWFPLGPREVFVPPYRHTAPYLHQINTPHVPSTRVVDKVLADLGNRRYIHQTVPSAVTVAPLRLLGEGRPVAGALLRPDHRDLGRQPLSVRQPEPPGHGGHRPAPAISGVPDRPAPLTGTTPAPLPASPAAAITGAARPAPSGPAAMVPAAPRLDPSQSAAPAPSPWRRDPEPATVVPPRPASPAAAPAMSVPSVTMPAQAVPPAPVPVQRFEPAPRPVEQAVPRPRPTEVPAGMPVQVPPRPSLPSPTVQMPVPSAPTREAWRGEARPALNMEARDQMRSEAQIKGQSMGGMQSGKPMPQGGRFMPQ